MKRLLSSLMTKFRMHSLRERSSPVNDPFPHQCGRRQILTALALVIMMAACYVTYAAAEGKLVKAQGTLTAIEEDRHVIIDGKGYAVDSSARVQDFRKKHVALDELTLPTGIHFEYVYTARGPVIKLIRELPQ